MMLLLLLRARRQRPRSLHGDVIELLGVRRAARTKPARVGQQPPSCRGHAGGGPARNNRRGEMTSRLGARSESAAPAIVAQLAVAMAGRDGRERSSFFAETSYRV